MSAPEPISPELALVSPELAAAARRALPDRPWEAFAPPRPVAPPALRLTVLRAEAVAAGPPLPEHPRRRVLTFGRLATAALVALLVGTSFLPPRHAPRLVAADPVPVARAAPATPPRFRVLPTAELECAAAGGQRDPFRPVCPPGRSR